MPHATMAWTGACRPIAPLIWARVRPKFAFVIFGPPLTAPRPCPRKDHAFASVRPAVISWRRPDPSASEAANDDPRRDGRIRGYEEDQPRLDRDEFGPR
jgi:hypothetical protein